MMPINVSFEINYTIDSLGFDTVLMFIQFIMLRYVCIFGHLRKFYSKQVPKLDHLHLRSELQLGKVEFVFFKILLIFLKKLIKRT